MSEQDKILQKIIKNANKDLPTINEVKVKLNLEKGNKGFLDKLYNLIRSFNKVKKAKSDIKKKGISLSSLSSDLNNIYKREEEINNLINTHLLKGIEPDIKKFQEKCANEELKKDLEQNNIINYLQKLVRQNTNESVCCNNDIDMSKFTLKTSIPPCSNYIPKDQLEAAKKYNTWIKHNIQTEQKFHIHKHKVSDKFSIIFIVLLVLMAMIIISKIF